MKMSLDLSGVAELQWYRRLSKSAWMFPIHTQEADPVEHQSEDHLSGDEAHGEESDADDADGRPCGIRWRGAPARLPRFAPAQARAACHVPSLSCGFGCARAAFVSKS